MLSEYVRAVEGIQTFGIFGLLVSIVLFAGIVVRALRIDRSTLHHMKRLPLDPGTIPEEHPTKVHHE